MTLVKKVRNGFLADGNNVQELSKNTWLVAWGRQRWVAKVRGRWENMLAGTPGRLLQTTWVASKFVCRHLNPQGDAIWSWWLWEGIRLRYSQKVVPSCWDQWLLRRGGSARGSAPCHVRMARRQSSAGHVEGIHHSRTPLPLWRQTSNLQSVKSQCLFSKPHSPWPFFGSKPGCLGRWGIYVSKSFRAETMPSA